MLSSGVSQASRKTLEEKLLDIEEIQKNSLKHQQRNPVPLNPSVQTSVPPKKKTKSGMPQYLTYQGKTRHCCRGRCIYGSQPKWSAFSFIFFNIPPILLYSTVTPVSSYCLTKQML
jgi:hypothetical protein